MKTPLVEISILSIYKQNNIRIMIPKRMAKCTPDTYYAINAIKNELEKSGGSLYLSDLYRSYDMQLQAYLDWKTKKKTAYSPPPGGSLHEAGRAFDLDLENLKIPLSKFWKLAEKYGVYPIIDKPVSSKSEAWHFDCRGSHCIVYDYYKIGFGNNFQSPYKAMAISAILSTGEKVEMFGENQKAAAIQAGLIRLGFKLGNIDGNIGAKTRAALKKAGITGNEVDELLNGVEDLLQSKFPKEYTIGSYVDVEGNADDLVPEHIVG
jgi:hypothetical protein